MRMVQGESQYWAIGKNLVARVPLSCLGADGRPTAEVTESLTARDNGMSADASVYNLTALVTTRCNLACSYCFQNAALPTAAEGGVPVRIPGSTVDDGSVADILAFTRARMSELDKSSVRLVLFGGEPTMYLDHCLKLLEGCRDIGLAGAAMISNGTLLSAPAAIALENAGLQWVQITFDGDKPEHDRSRITVGGRGTFEQIVGNVAAASERTGLTWQLRVNLSEDSIDGADALIDRLADRLDPGKFVLKFTLVYDVGIGYQKSLRHSTAMAHRVGDLHLRAMDAGFTAAVPRLNACKFCEEVGGTTGAVVNSDGAIYSCYHSAGQPGYDVGSVAAGYHAEPVVASRWVRCGYDSTTDKEAEQRQADIVNAAILDRLYAKGMLATATRGQSASMDH
jgi:uncharacterized protein